VVAAPPLRCGTLRRYLRATKQGVGTGKRYEIKASDIPDLKKGFDAWRKEVTGAKAADTHTCPVCDKKFKSASGVASHVRSHSPSDRAALAPDTLTDEEREEFARLEAEEG
jgi:hypothetical protein